MPIQMLMTMKYCDNFEVWVRGPLMRPVTHAIYDVATVLARMFGLTPLYKEYLPAKLHIVAFTANEPKRE